MSEQGPSIDALTHRLSECPAEFLLEPRIRKRGMVHVDAVVADLLVALGAEMPDFGDLRAFYDADKKMRNYLRLALVGCWLGHDPWFLGRGLAARFEMWVREDLNRLSGLVSAELFVTDDARREELARSCLRRMGILPAGEDAQEAADRFSTLDSVERERLIRESRAQAERARQVREAMEAERAREAAARYSRE